MRGWVKAAAAAVVLGLGGWAAEPFARDWMLTGSACDGALPREAAGQLRPGGTHVEEESSRHTEELGSYTCDVTLDGGNDLFWMRAHTRRDDQDTAFMRTFPKDGWSWQAPLPDGLPGFLDDRGTISLMLPCPDLGEDDDGRPRKLLIRTGFGQDALTGVPGAAYRTVVAPAGAAHAAFAFAAAVSPASPVTHPDSAATVRTHDRSGPAGRQWPVPQMRKAEEEL
ncbi:hypothetical protein [Streptomyces xinghaiensis]|uniref:hypothetical protein n=1 Tax=Streptomyces xinghaiensis TaxID=1038928 RepID=UPI00030F348E|nr:hypothetical protein [Streptomyces xinghaiensis]MZE80533.1 hypothetical protein [Streptomyces sp. SID5475]